MGADVNLLSGVYRASRLSCLVGISNLDLGDT